MERTNLGIYSSTVCAASPAVWELKLSTGETFYEVRWQPKRGGWRIRNYRSASAAHAAAARVAEKGRL